MRNTKRLLLLLFGLILSTAMVAQDLHWSQYLYSPLNLSPAETGAFDGRLRFAGNYRNQWKQVSRPFETFAASAEFNKPFSWNKWAIGINAFHDVAGTNRLAHDMIGLNIGYHQPLDENERFILSTGVQFSGNQESLSSKHITTDNQYFNGRHNPDAPTNEFFEESSSFLNTAAGIAITSKLEDQQFFKIGIGIHNILEPYANFGILQNRGNYRRYSIYMNSLITLGKQWTVGPSLLYHTQHQYNEFVIGADFTYILDPSTYHYRALFIGGWTRIQDAGFVTVGGHYDNWRLGLSYDINYSPFVTATNYRGAFEVSLIYILKDLLPKRSLYKNCPDYL